MTHRHKIPVATMRRRPHPLLLAGMLIVVLALALARHAWYLERWPHYRLITVIWTIGFVIVAFQWVASWLERPYTVTDRQQRMLDTMKITVNVPVYNEEPVVLDRVLYALFAQSRLPDRIQVVDDGSTKEDYTEVRDYWLAHSAPGVDFTWVRQENQGKKRAQARTFRGDDADVFVTLDSDTTLERDALREGIKPFANPRVYSVAGLELAWNHDCNLLTRIKSVNALVWQFVTCSAQHVLGGSVLVNRGTFALYRGNMIRETLDAYIGERFLGRPVMLADDTMLTLFALGRGRAVQQPNAVCYAMYPETLSHTMRQWLRWMRGTSLRTLWRIRYLTPKSWGWWYTILITWGYLAFMSVFAAVLIDWPSSRLFAITALYISAGWTWIVASRIFVLRRSDQTWLQTAEAFFLVPIALLWMTIVLRPVRLYGTLTMGRQGWVTRQAGAETRTVVALEPQLPVVVGIGSRAGAAIGADAGDSEDMVAAS